MNFFGTTTKKSVYTSLELREIFKGDVAQLRTRISIWSWGEVVFIKCVERNKEEEYHYEISSKPWLPTQFIDLIGKNKKNVDKIVATIEEGYDKHDFIEHLIMD